MNDKPAEQRRYGICTWCGYPTLKVSRPDGDKVVCLFWCGSCGVPLRKVTRVENV